MATAAEIQAFFAANPNLPDDAVYNLMVQNGVTPQELISALGLNPETAMQSYATQAEAAFNAVPNGYQPTGQSPQTAAPSLTPAQMNPTPGNVSDEYIRYYLQQNPNASDQQIAALMQQYNVSPMQMANALGTDYANVLPRYREAQAMNTPTGLVGQEEELRRAAAEASGTLRGAETSARADITSALANINNLYGISIEDLQGAASQARTDINAGFGQAEQYFRPYQQGGEQAYQQQLALSGALGQGAFNQARQQSPYEQFLYEQGMRANLSGAAATGGIGGGNVQKELQRFGQGLASQGLQQQIGNLSALSGMGIQGSQALSGLATGRAGALGDIGMNTAQNVAAQRGQQAGYAGQAGAGLANIGMQTGAGIADYQYSAGQGIANQRARAGELIANQIGNTIPSYADLLQSQGSNLSGMIGQQTGNLVNMNQGAANTAAQNAINLSGEYGNLQTGLATNQANLTTGQQLAQAPAANYSQMLGGTLEAAGAGYNMGQMYQSQQPATPRNTVGPLSGTYAMPGYIPPYQPPMGQVGGSGGVQPFNIYSQSTGNTIYRRLP